MTLSLAFSIKWFDTWTTYVLTSFVGLSSIVYNDTSQNNKNILSVYAHNPVCIASKFISYASKAIFTSVSVSGFSMMHMWSRFPNHQTFPWLWLKASWFCSAENKNPSELWDFLQQNLAFHLLVTEIVCLSIAKSIGVVSEVYHIGLVWWLQTNTHTHTHCSRFSHNQFDKNSSFRHSVGDS